MKRSLRPIKVKDPRTYDFHRTFGGVDVSTIPTEFNMDYMGQQGIFPDQVEDRFPEACTAYTVTGNASNDDNVNYDDKNFTYTKTKLMMGVEGDVPCDQMTAMKSGTVYGVRKKGQGDADALGNRRAPYFIVKKLNGSYWEGIISALWKKQGTLNCGSYWPQAFENIGRDGIIPPFTVPTDWDEGHNWEACGIKILQGEPRLIVKSWQGVHYGDNGYAYLTRAQVETLFSGNGFGIFGQKHASPEDIRTVKIAVIETLINFIQRLIAKMQFGFAYLGVYFGSRTFGAARSPHWGAVRAAHLKISPNCVICGHHIVNVHHIKPFHLNPALELEPTNLITLCDGLGTKNHHIEFGHLFSWKSWNENVVADASLWKTKITTRP